MTNVMSSSFRKSAGSFLNFIKTQLVPERHYIYYSEKIAKDRYAKKFGYKEKILRSGPLPRLKDDKPLPMPVYRPADPWTKQKATAGQNDYIDILGGGRLKPFNVTYDVPQWLRGKRGNELKLLILKEKVFSHTLFELENPTIFNNMRRRIKYLYRYLNNKTKTGVSLKE